MRRIVTFPFSSGNYVKDFEDYCRDYETAFALDWDEAKHEDEKRSAAYAK